MKASELKIGDRVIISKTGWWEHKATVRKIGLSGNVQVCRDGQFLDDVWYCDEKNGVLMSDCDCGSPVRRADSSSADMILGLY